MGVFMNEVCWTAVEGMKEATGNTDGGVIGENSCGTLKYQREEGRRKRRGEKDLAKMVILRVVLIESCIRLDPG